MNSAASARRDALLATAAFSVALLSGMKWRVDNWSVSWPLVVYYAVLMFSTFFSIRFFCQYIRITLAQRVADAAFIMCYFYMAWQLNHPLRFALAAAVLFGVSVVKYRLAEPFFPYPATLRRKIKANSWGAAAAIAAAIGVRAGYSRPSLLVWIGAFTLANIYFIWGAPLFRLSSDKQG